MNKILLAALLSVTATAAAQTVTGAGASFPYPLYSKMFSEYKNETGVSVNYQSVGSGAGQRQILAKTVDFGASDAPMKDEDLAKADGKLLHVPTALGAVVPVYNVPGVNGELKFSGKVLADIYLGNIKTWNDPAIVKLNQDARLPALPITVVRRSDGSGTTAVFTDFLSKVSPAFQKQVGTGTSVSWPVGVGAKGNEGVTGTVKNTPGSLGYTELAYAVQNKIPYASVQNKAGKFVKATEQAVTEAAGAVVLPADTRVSITNPPASAANAYPIGSYTYVIFYQDQKYADRPAAQARTLKDLLTWMVTTGQQYNEPLNYSRLPDNAQTRARAIINSMTYGGQPVK